MFPVKYTLSFYELVIEQLSMLDAFVDFEELNLKTSIPFYPYISLAQIYIYIYKQLFLFQTFDVQSDVTYVSS